MVMGVFVLSSALNYLDRQVLAALAPVLRAEFSLTNAGYGMVLAAFSITYAISSPLAGLMIDRFGLNRAISAGVGLWSMAGVATGFARGLPGLVGCRAVLGAAESCGVPAVGKALHRYLLPGERALGNAFSQIGLSVGAIAAPPLAVWFALHYGWRSAFVFTGVLGLAWIPLWLWASRKAAAVEDEEGALPHGRGSVREGLNNSSSLGLLRDVRLWGFVAANILSMPVYTLWSNWTTLFLKEAQGASFVHANLLAPVPNFFAYAGGLAGGWLSLHWTRAGVPALDARRKVCRVSAVLLLATAAVPWMPGPGWATAAISLSFFAITAWSVNLYTMPLDAFGGRHAAFSVSLLTGAYGAMQAVISPLIGATIDKSGYAPVCIVAAILPLAAYGILSRTR
jgi:ACS family hexuronate transporter-like MFS transporter